MFGGCFGYQLTPGMSIHNNMLRNNDIGIALENWTDTCTAQTAVVTGEDVHNNVITNDE